MIRQQEFKDFGAIGYLQKGKGTQKKEAPSRTSFLRYAGTTLSLLGCHQEGFMIPRTCAEKETQIIRSLRGEANSVQTYPNLFPWKKKKTTVFICTGLMAGAPLRAPSSSVWLYLLCSVGTCSGTLYLQSPWLGCSYSEGNLSSLLKTTRRLSLSV